MKRQHAAVGLGVRALEAADAQALEGARARQGHIGLPRLEDALQADVHCVQSEALERRKGPIGAGAVWDKGGVQHTWALWMVSAHERRSGSCCTVSAGIVRSRVGRGSSHVQRRITRRDPSLNSTTGLSLESKARTTPRDPLTRPAETSRLRMSITWAPTLSSRRGQAGMRFMRGSDSRADGTTENTWLRPPRACGRRGKEWVRAMLTAEDGWHARAGGRC